MSYKPKRVTIPLIVLSCAALTVFAAGVLVGRGQRPPAVPAGPLPMPSTILVSEPAEGGNGRRITQLDVTRSYYTSPTPGVGIVNWGKELPVRKWTIHLGGVSYEGVPRE